MAMKSTREIEADLDARCSRSAFPGHPHGFFSSDAYTTREWPSLLPPQAGRHRDLPSLWQAADTINESEVLAAIQELQLLVELRRTHPIAVSGSPACRWSCCPMEAR